MATILSWFCVAALAIAIDFAYARWMVCVTKGKTYQAMLWSAICPLLGFCSLWICFNELTALIPNAIGCAVGTWLVMRWCK